MKEYLGYFFLGAGLLAFEFAWFNQSRKTMAFLFVGTMMIMAGLAILQYLGSEPPPY